MSKEKVNNGDQGKTSNRQIIKGGIACFYEVNKKFSKLLVKILSEII